MVAFYGLFVGETFSVRHFGMSAADEEDLSDEEEKDYKEETIRSYLSKLILL